MEVLGTAFGRLAKSIEGKEAKPTPAQLFPAEARAASAIQVPWEQLSQGSAIARLALARRIAGEIVAVAGAVLPADVPCVDLTADAEDGTAAAGPSVHYVDRIAAVEHLDVGHGHLEQALA